MSAPRAHQVNIHGGYDQSLLSEIPEVSKAERQEGYNVDLLNEQATPPRSTNPQSVVPKEQYQSIGPGAGARKVPFWRTRNGLITLAIAAIVIVGAVVGGAVGGTVGQPAKKEAAKAATGVSNVTSAPSNASQSQINVAPVASAPTTPPNNGTR